ncbi:hypothetical protein C8J57DRAFT_1223666 [Mycena rebaudengoi]|nr:hypothetical protein C8J57DRAFT_1223666 [Mycena rebaudengoi]
MSLTLDGSLFLSRTPRIAENMLQAPVERQGRSNRVSRVYQGWSSGRQIIQIARPTRIVSRAKEIASKSTAIPNVPPELWALIASFSSRWTIAHLCLLSRTFNIIFSPHLYMNLLEPCLTAEQSSLLLRTIRQQPSPASIFHHPASLIRKLSVTDGGFTLKPAKFKVQARCSARALDNLRLLPLSGQRGASLLRVLHRGITAGIQELGKILSSPGNFPHLRELVVTSRGNNASVDVLNFYKFIQIPGLEVLGCDIEPARFNYEQHRVAEKMCYNLSEALKMLPFSSPRLRALMLKLSLDYFEEACGLAPIPNTTAEFLTKLRSFAGSFEQCGIILGKNCNVERIVLTFKRSVEVYQTILVASIPPTPLHSVTRVAIRAVDEDNGLLIYPYELGPQFYSGLVSFFPNVTHLDIVLAMQLKRFTKSITSLVALQYLRVQEYRFRVTDHMAVTEACPASDYILLVKSFLPSLLRLSDVVISMTATMMSSTTTTSSPQMKAVYHFRVERDTTAARVCLIDSKVLDPSRKQSTERVRPPTRADACNVPTLAMSSAISRALEVYFSAQGASDASDTFSGSPSRDFV